MAWSIAFCVLLLLALAPGVPAPPANGPPRTQYDEAEAKLLLNLSAGAYAADPQGCLNTTFSGNAYLYQVFTASNLVCDILSNSCASYTLVNDQERRIYVVFRGTKTKQQLLLEGWTTLHPGGDFFGAGKANKYFSKALETLWPRVQAVLTDPRYKTYPVTFTGHSLGGALASLAGLKTALQELRTGAEIHVVTFGQPRVGDVELATRHNALLPYSFRVVHSDDIVPHLPKCAKDIMDPRITGDSKPCNPADPEDSYHHGVEIWYPTGMGPEDSYYECLGTPVGEDFECSDSLTFEWSKTKRYIWAHRHYFGHKVPPYGKRGCQDDPELDELEYKNGKDEDDDEENGDYPQDSHFNAKRAWRFLVSKLGFKP